MRITCSLKNIMHPYPPIYGCYVNNLHYLNKMNTGYLIESEKSGKIPDLSLMAQFYAAGVAWWFWLESE